MMIQLTLEILALVTLYSGKFKLLTKLEKPNCHNVPSKAPQFL